ncbi:translocation/assembly module TamB domain-containing protein [Granulicella paludicola]|uniref:translocation/assembly module TamB domain-containing protein n=1 Tax=Granulicella paludicola TaxID=474951 RepID=UPI0021E0F58C|nr:translocation/assembly module TamB domain-containing protein [Granulicella paludicola]
MTQTPETNSNATPPTHSVTRRVLTLLAWVVGGIVVLLGAAALYTTTDDFQRRVGKEVTSLLEDSLGGHVELGRIEFSLWHLAIEADNLVVHGSEPAGESPYLSVGKILVRVKINTFMNHVAGQTVHSRIGLNLLRVEQPHFHLIVDKDGHTNAPVPKHPSASTEPIQDTLLDLQATKVELVNGITVVNDKAIPLNLAANDLQAEVAYIRKSDRYGITVDLGNLRTQMAVKPEVQSRLHLSAEVGRDAADLKTLTFASGTDTKLTIAGSLNHFNKPAWKVFAKGKVDLKQVGYLADVDGLNGGLADIDMQGHTCLASPPAPAKKPHFWQKRKATIPASKVPAAAPDCNTAYLVSGNILLHGADYVTEDVRLHGINGHAVLHITPETLAFPDLLGVFPTGGEAQGSLRIENWLGTAPVDATHGSLEGKVVPAPNHAYVNATVTRIPLRTIMDVTAPEHYGDLGFDTSITGPVSVEWIGAVPNVSTTVQVGANLALSPTGTRRKGALSNIPVSGSVIAKYLGRTEVVNIQQVLFQTPQTTLKASGVLGVSDGDPLTNLQADLQARDLGEFDQLLQTLGFEANGKKGSAAIPVVLHGTMNFAGTAKGPIRNLDVKGHLGADNLAVKLGTEADIHIDNVIADAEYSPFAGIAVASSTVTQGKTVLNVAGSYKPHKVVTRRRTVDYVWDDQGEMDVTAKLANAQAIDLLTMAGQQQKIPVTGTVNLNAHAQGTVKDIHGTGSVTLANGVAYDEPYQLVSVDLGMEGQQIDVSKLTVRAHDMTVTGSGGYNLDSKIIRAQLSGNQIQLSKLVAYNKLNANADGSLSFTVSANGTLEQPGLKANLKLDNVVTDGKALGNLTATATSTGSNVNYELHSTLIGAQVAATGQTNVTGDYQTQAKLTLSGLNIANAIAVFAPDSIKGSSDLSGTVTVSGPLAKPQQLSGTAEFQNIDVTLAGVELKSAEPLRASLNSGTLTLNALHITGQDTDLRASGTAHVFGDTNPQGGVLNISTSGNVNTALAHSFDPDLITSGKLTFKMAVQGRMKKPQLTGNVQVQNVNLAVDGVANGLSNMNGTLAFNEDRLNVENLTATTGGGQLKIGGYLAYQKGLFADLTATGEAVRVRLYGLSSTATANLRLQGTPQSMQLSGNVLVTRFGIGPDVDFSAFNSGPSIPPSPDAATNKIHLDVRVKSAPQLDFQNSYAKLAGSVDLTVRGTVAIPSILGRIQITEGKATFAGTSYELTRGSITFSNPVRIDPVIDLDAQARVETYDITIGLHGTMNSLHPTYRSQPPLTEADIFNLLALGRTQEEAQIYQQQQQQAGSDSTTNAVLGGALNATVLSRVNKLFGAGSVKIDPTYVGTLGGSSARITVVEPISKQVTLTFATNVNQTAQELIQVAYQINQSTALVLTRDENGVFSIVYKIRKRYR